MSAGPSPHRRKPRPNPGQGSPDYDQDDDHVTTIYTPRVRANSAFREYNVVLTFSVVFLEKPQCTRESPRHREGEPGRMCGANCVSIRFTVLQD
jgi:hypothetical protein